MQADELVHEDDLPKIKEAMTRYADDLEVEGLLLKYYHFYGGYNYHRIDRRWPPGGVRIVRNGINVYSANDAQSFYIANRRRMHRFKVADIGAHIYHYGRVRNPEMMKKKKLSTAKYWHSEKETSKLKSQSFDFHNVNPKYLKAFSGSHPKVMQDRISKHGWTFDPSRCYYKPTPKSLFHDFQWLIERGLKKRIFGPHYCKIVK